MGAFPVEKDAGQLRAEVLQYTSGHIKDSIYAIKQAVIAGILDQAALSIEQDTYFFGHIDCVSASAAVRDRLQEEFSVPLTEANVPAAIRQGEALRAYWGLWDFGHTAPNWQNVLTLGLSGLKARAERSLAAGEKTPEQAAFLELVISHYNAAFSMLRRMADLADTADIQDQQLAPGLRSITERPPETLYEAMQTVIVYFVLQAIVDDNNVRSLGRLDVLLNPFYQTDLESGRLGSAQARQLTRTFLARLAQFRACANLPFAICGEYHGTDRSNAYTRLLLEEFIALSSPDLKLHFLYAGSTPHELVRLAADAIISGSNSIVFMNDALVQSALSGVGIGDEDAAEYAMVGCYEPCAREELCCSCNGMLNLGKAVEAALNGGHDPSTGDLIGAEVPTDFDTFQDFYSAFSQQLAHFAEAAKALTRAREASYPLINTGGFLSSTLDSCMDACADAYAGYGAKYENSSINAIGLATAADSLLAVKKLVFEEKKLSFAQLRQLMRSNWQDDPRLRLWIKNRFRGYGTNNSEADALAGDILRILSGSINNSPNSKGGVFRLGAFSVDNRVFLGTHVGATPDGRAAGEPLSKNLGANLWADHEGVTAHILSAAQLDGHLFPNGSVLDLVLHESAVRGRSGRENFRTMLKVFMELGGFAVHFNVLDPGVLRKAQQDPEKYSNLQIRLCGWNVLFSRLSQQEQNEFIYASERQQ